LTKWKQIVPLSGILRNRNNMKNLFALLVVAGLIFTTSCGNQETETEETIEITVEETEEMEMDSMEIESEEMDSEEEVETEEVAA